MIAERPPPLPGSPLNRNAHERASQFASAYPDRERRQWAYRIMYLYALRKSEPRRR